ncbi:3'-5' exonuclease isoform X3 [Coffea arabica]|uniref:3'-5' exonuclease n=1 Tax=Coffea arabica TaxID=13443 RepID=A0ABM4X2M2_COFAR
MKNSKPLTKPFCSPPRLPIVPSPMKNSKPLTTPFRSPPRLPIYPSPMTNSTPWTTPFRSPPRLPPPQSATCHVPRTMTRMKNLAGDCPTPSSFSIQTTRIRILSPFPLVIEEIAFPPTLFAVLLLHLLVKYCLRSVVMRYPEIAFKGRIVYSRGFDEVEKSAEELLSFVELKRRNGGQAILGFDIEWRPTFRRGVTPRKTAVMQICGDNNVCYVMHVIHSGIPQNLKSLLENPTSVKVGVCIANDAFKIFKDHNVSVKALEDLSDLANHKLGGDCKKWSLSSLTETLICKQLPKPNRIRLGNWETDVLSKEQLHYAATDAFVSWYLYEALQTLPEAENKKIEESVVLSS